MRVPCGLPLPTVPSGGEPDDGHPGVNFGLGPARTFEPSARLSTIVLVIVIAVLSQLLAKRQDPPEPVAVDELAQVRRVVDGDTLLLEDGRRVRLIGVDTPETVRPDSPVEPFGPEAAEFTKKLLSGKQVRLEYDRERFDQYQRTLAYVFFGDLFVNEELIRQGYSAAQLQYPYRSDIKTRFKAAEKQAREQRLGIWSLSESGH